MKYVLGIDQGGTKTHALVAEASGRILGVGRGAGGCHSLDGMDRAMAAVDAAVREAMGMARLRPADMAAVGAGMTGVDWPEEAGLLQGALSRAMSISAGRIHVVND